MLTDVDKHNIDVKIIETELDRTILVETYDTVVEMNQTYPDRELCFVFGADSTETMLEWKGGQWLLDNLPMLVIARDGHTLNPLARSAVELKIKTPPISSTEVRARLAEGLKVDDLVSSTVLALL